LRFSSFHETYFSFGFSGAEGWRGGLTGRWALALFFAKRRRSPGFLA